MTSENSDFEQIERAGDTLECARPRARGPWRLDIGAAASPGSAVLRPGDELTLGSGRGSNLVVSDAAVSGLHCRLTALASGVAVVDHGSKNGLYVGGARVESAVLSEEG